MDIDLSSRACWEKLDISSTSFQEIKYRLGYKGKDVTLEMFEEIEEIVEDIRDRYEKVTVVSINRYWNYVRKSK